MGGINVQILVLDDSDTMRDIIVKALLEIGFNEEQIHQASNGVQALQMLDAFSFDILLLDLVMDGVNGMDVLKAAKTIQPSAKIIMCSTFSKSETVKELIDIGINDFVVKPFDVNRLKDAIFKQIPMGPSSFP